MAVTITGDEVITTLGVVHVYTLTGTELQRPVPPNPETMEQMKYPITWFGDNTFDMRVGEYEKVWRDPTDHSKGYDFKQKNPESPLDTTKVSIIVDEDLWQGPDDFIIYCTYWKTDGTYDTASFNGHVAVTVSPPAPTYKLRIKAPTFTPTGSNKPRPGTFSFLGTDSPKTTSLATKFFTTYPSELYDHCINYSADSMHYWDNGHFEHTVVTPSNNEITQNLNLNDFAPEAMFTGHVNVSIIATVSTKGKVPMEVIDQRGYMIHIEYSVGQATGFRYLVDGATEKYLINEDDKKLAAIPTYD